MRSLLFVLAFSVLGCAPRVVYEPVPPDGSRSPPTLVVERDPSTWRVATYPLWGLPRDLVDAPLTFLNRTGMSLAAYERDELSSADVFVVATSLAAAYVGFVGGWDYANSHFYEQMFYSEIFAGVAGVVGFAAGITGVAGYEYVVVPLQVALLRTGVDVEYWKGDATRVVLDPASDDTLERLETSHRSTCYFPNWQLATGDIEFALEALSQREP